MLDSSLIRYHKGRLFILTAGRWSWKSKPAKECVTTHLPKQLALKMDGAKASHLYSAVQLELTLEVLTTERVGRSLR